MTDVAARNREVTRGYYALSQRFKNRIGGDASWTTFATWASAQAGRTIRKQDLERALERRLGDSPVVRRIVEGPLRIGVQHITRAVLQLNPFERSSQAVARGNIKVYEEIGAEMARFLALVESGATDAQFSAFIDGLKPGPPPDAQDYLKRAFRAYLNAFALPDGRDRSQWVFAGNVAIGYHEQTRLQPEIAGAVDGSFWDGLEVKDRILDLLAPEIGSVRRFASALALRAIARPELEPLVSEARRLIHEIITEALMVLELPDETLRLGRDLRGAICASLTPLENTDARALLAAIDVTPDSLAGTGTDDWTDFAQRIHYIADLFRSRQDRQRLFEQTS
jgi:hypothetical protein